jgi:hypothetical protein
MMRIKAVSNFPEAAEATISDLKMALNASGEMVMTISKRDFVPVQTGLLQGSGFVEEAEQRGDLVVTTLGYGGAARDYAVAVHEAPPTWGQGKNKYLSKPLYMLSGDVPRWMAKLMSAAVQRRKGVT